MKTLVTGGAGFIGSHLVDRLLAEGNDVIVLDNFATGRAENLKQHKGNRRLKVVEWDISTPFKSKIQITKSKSNPKSQIKLNNKKPNILKLEFGTLNFPSFQSFFENVDWVFHLAALADIVPSIVDPLKYHRSNVDGTVNVLEASRKAGVSRFIYAASSSCYGIAKHIPTRETDPIDPKYPYALTKFIAEQYVLHFGKVYKLPVVSLRMFNVYGPRSRTSGTYGAVFGVFLAQKLAGKPFTVVGNGSQTRDFTYVTDVVDAFVKAAQSSVAGEVFNVGTGIAQNVNRLVKLLGGQVTYIPKRPGEPDTTCADIEKIQKVLGWSPKVSFKQGINMMLKNIDYWRKAPVWTPKTIKEATREWFHYLS